MKAGLFSADFNVAAMVVPAPAEKPIMPIRFGSMFHSLARARTSLKAAVASSSGIATGEGGGAAPPDFAGGAERGLPLSNSAQSGAVGINRYFNTKAATPFAFSA